MDFEENILDIIDEEVSDDPTVEEDEQVEGSKERKEIMGKKKTRRGRRGKKTAKKEKKTVLTADINRFVNTVCKELKEKKTHMVYTAIHAMGKPAFTNLVEEVKGILKSGGQKTATGDRYKTGGGILWSIIKAQNRNIYDQIMRETKDLEKKFAEPEVEPESQCWC